MAKKNKGIRNIIIIVVVFLVIVSYSGNKGKKIGFSCGGGSSTPTQSKEVISYKDEICSWTFDGGWETIICKYSEEISSGDYQYPDSLFVDWGAGTGSGSFGLKIFDFPMTIQDGDVIRTLNSCTDYIDYSSEGFCNNGNVVVISSKEGISGEDVSQYEPILRNKFISVFG